MLKYKFITYYYYLKIRYIFNYYIKLALISKNDNNKNNKAFEAI